MADHHPGASQHYQPEYLLLGEILRPHGIRGEVRVRILTDYPDRIIELEQVHVGSSPNSGTAQPYTVESMRMHKAYGLIKFKEIRDRNDAERLRKMFMMVTVDDAIPLEVGEFYLYQLIGLSVKTVDGQHLGIVRDVIETGANDVYMIDSPQYGEFLIPAIDQTIVETNIETGTLIVRLLEGQLPDKR